MELKFLGLPNRFFYALAGSVFCVLVELLLHQFGVLTWDCPWWNVGAPWLIFLIGYLPFFLVAFWVFDLPRMRSKITVVGSILGFDALCLVLFVGILHWIKAESGLEVKTRAVFDEIGE